MIDYVNVRLKRRSVYVAAARMAYVAMTAVGVTLFILTVQGVGL